MNAYGLKLDRTYLVGQRSCRRSPSFFCQPTALIPRGARWGKLTKLESIGGNQFNAEYEDRRFNFEVTPLGRIFRIQSSQELGRFAIDDVFTASLAARLTEKYGAPLSSSPGSYGWQIVEPVKRSDGRTLPFTTMWMSAFVSNGPGVSDVSLEMKMIDFRILWEDQAKVNRAPRDKAAQGISL